MIVKKVKNPKKSSSKAVRITRLTAYVRAPESERSHEKCIYAGARNFITDTPAGQAAEMIALAEESVRSKDPIVHYVLSWPDGEQPRPDQVEAAVDIYLNELAVPAHQVVYGLHADTDNIHLHIVINRVHPDTCKCIDISSGFDIEAAHRAIARIEQAQGWRPEQHGRYRVLDDGRVERRYAGPEPFDSPGQPAAHQTDTAQPLEESSALRIAIETGAPILHRAQSWKQLHRELAEVGMRYERSGNGPTLFVGETGVDPKQVSPDAGLTRLQIRLGVYERAPRQPAPVTPRKMEPDRPKRPGSRQVDMEHRTGEKSALRIAIETGAPILHRAQSWKQLHRELAEVGMRYERTDNGPTLFVGETGVDPKQVSPDAGLTRLYIRLGVYERAPRQPAPITPRKMEPDRPKRPGSRQVDMEHRTGEKSALRIAIETGAPILHDAQSWKQLHRELAEVGMRYERTGSGATVFVGEIGVKASSVDRQASLSKLQARLGAYEPPAQPAPIEARDPEPIKPMPREWKDYIDGRHAHYANKASVKADLDQILAEHRRTLSEQQRARRSALLRGNWRGRGDALNDRRSKIAAEQAAERAKLKKPYRDAREKYRQRFRPYPDFKRWQQETSARPYPPVIAGERNEPPTPRNIRGFRPAIRGSEVHYTRAELPEGPDQPVSFVDQGKCIQVHEWHQDAAALAALQLAAEKWEHFTVDGSDKFKALCARLAAEHGFNLTIPELQDTVGHQRQARQQTDSRAPSVPQRGDRDIAD